MPQGKSSLHKIYSELKNFCVCDCSTINTSLVEKVRESMPDERVISTLATFYKIIGDSTRCKILYALSQCEMCVCDLSNVLNMTKSTISHQLAKLKDLRIVKYRREGKAVYYSLDDEHVAQVYSISLKHITHTV